MAVKLNNQSGMTSLGMLGAVMLVVGGALLAIKLAPLYIDDFAIGKALASFETESHLYETPKKKIRDALRRKLTADYTRDLQDDEIIIVKNKGNITIDVNYEARVPVVYNLDIVAKFKHHFEQTK